MMGLVPALYECVSRRMTVQRAELEGRWKLYVNYVNYLSLHNSPLTKGNPTMILHNQSCQECRSALDFTVKVMKKN